MWYIFGNHHAFLWYLKGRPDRQIQEGLGRGSNWWACARYDSDQIPRAVRYGAAGTYGAATRPYVQCAVASWRLTNGLTSMEKYGVNQSWEGCARTVQYRATFRYVAWAASDKVLRQDSATMQYNEFLYLVPTDAVPSPACAAAVGGGPTCAADDRNCLCTVGAGLAALHPVQTYAAPWGPTGAAWGAQLRMIQARGDMYAGRGQYAVTREQPGALGRYSTTLVPLLNVNAQAAWQSTANDISFYATMTGTKWDRTAAGRASALGISAAQLASAVGGGSPQTVSAQAGNALEVHYAEEPIMLRFHLVSPQPGVVKGLPACSAVPGCATVTAPATFATRQTPVVNTVDPANWVYSGGLWKRGVLGAEAMYVGVLNMRNKRVTHRIPLEDCGDAKVNVTAYEDCELEEAQTGDGAFTFRARTVAAGKAYLDPYPASTSTNGAYAQANPAGEPTGISDYDYTLGGVPVPRAVTDPVRPSTPAAPAFWQKATRTYYECDEICLKVVRPTCPDSRASNGGDGLDPRNPAVTGGPVRELCDEGPETSLAARTAGL